MNKQFAPIDARVCNLMRSHFSAGGTTRLALHHCPGEGCGGSA